MDEEPTATASAGDPAALGGLLATIAAWAGLGMDETTAARLAPLVARTLADWAPLTRAAAPGLEPMGPGPEREATRARR